MSYAFMARSAGPVRRPDGAGRESTMRREWNDFALDELERAYGPDEPEYSEADLKPEEPA